MRSPLLQIRDATKIYASGGIVGGKKTVVALDNFNMTIDGSPATITTIAGESGSGKTTLANLVLGFIKLTSGKIIFDGEDITYMTNEQLKAYRRNVQAVFQDPFGVYNPFYRIEHVFELVNRHFSLSDNQSEFRDMVEAGLNVVGLYGEDVLRKYPHQLSGGQRQRIMMARAYMIKPRLIVADEPVSMVDASLRASILDAMLRLRDEHNISFLYITHDLSTAYQIGDQIYMLYQGTTAERGTAMDVIDAPQHPYVQLLIDSVPVPDPTDKWDVNISLPSEEEMRTAASVGCRYYPRCPHRMDKCLVEQPPLFKMDKPKHEAACYLYDENDIAPIEPPIIENQPLKIVEAETNRQRERFVAAILVVAAFIAGLFLATRGEPETIVETEEVIVVVTATAEVAVEAAAPTEEPAEQAAAPAEAVIEEPDFRLSPDGANDKGALTLNVDAVNEIADGDDRHAYTFAAIAGQQATLRLVTGGAGLSGSGFYAPFATMYAPDGGLALGLDSRQRSRREQLTFAATGEYTIVVGAHEGIGVEGYTITIEGEEPAPEPTAMPAPVEEPDFRLSPDGAVDKGALTLNVDTVNEIEDDDDLHRYTFQATAGQEVTLRLVTGGAGLSGSGFYAPFATIYAPDGGLALGLDSRQRSRRERMKLYQTGSYTIVVGAYEGIGVEGYTITIEGEAPPPEPTAVPASVEEPDFRLSAFGASEKGSLLLGVDHVDEIESDDDRHLYTFLATAGQQVTLRLVTGGAGLSGSGFYAPFATVYGPDGELVLGLDSRQRSRRERITFYTAGDYLIVVGSYEGIGIEGYTITIEGADG